MVYLRKLTRNQDKAIDSLYRQSEESKPKQPPRDPNYRHMQNIVDKWKRGEKL